MNAATLHVCAVPYVTGTPTDEMHRRHAWAITLSLSALGPRATDQSTKKIRSIKTQMNFCDVLIQFARFLEVNKAGNLKDFPLEMAELFLLARSKNVGAGQLKLDRWALQIFLNRKLPAIEAAIPQVLKPRALLSEYVEAIISAQQPHMALSTELAYSCGLRSVELITLATEDLQPRHVRPIPPYLFHLAPDGELLTVRGKGGLVRWVKVPHPLLERLQATLRKRPRQVSHQTAKYTSYFDIPGGHAWAQDFSKTCRALFGSSPAAHGLRHSYVERRLTELLTAGLSEREARYTVSVEIGHFRPSIIDHYTRGFWLP
jgi:integrase